VLRTSQDSMDAVSAEDIRVMPDLDGVPAGVAA
jgi:hypothetical protein